jgi:hypothetical protein
VECEVECEMVVDLWLVVDHFFGGGGGGGCGGGGGALSPSV